MTGVIVDRILPPHLQRKPSDTIVATEWGTISRLRKKRHVTQQETPSPQCKSTS